VRGAAPPFTARLGNAVQQTLLQFVAKGRHALGVFCERVAGDFRGFAEATMPATFSVPGRKPRW